MPPSPQQLLGLSIQQPWAELILRGIKAIEIRNVPVAVGKRIYLYAGKRLSRQDFAVDAIQRHELRTQDLEFGKVVGSVTITGCRPSRGSDEESACVPAVFLKGTYSWMLSDPLRLIPPVVPAQIPYGMWFYPFGSPVQKNSARGRA